MARRLALSLMLIAVTTTDKPLLAQITPAQLHQVRLSAEQGRRNRDDFDIYAAVLRFFRPFGGQIRWLDARLVSAPADSAQTLSSGLLDSLARRAGRHFEVLKPGFDPDSRSGGVVRLSQVVRFTTDSVRVAARYQHHTPYYTHRETDLSFLVVKRKGKWVLIRH